MPVEQGPVSTPLGCLWGSGRQGHGIRSTALRVECGGGGSWVPAALPLDRGSMSAAQCVSICGPLGSALCWGGT